MYLHLCFSIQGSHFLQGKRYLDFLPVNKFFSIIGTVITDFDTIIVIDTIVIKHCVSLT